MNGLQFTEYLENNPLTSPHLFNVVLRTEQKISKKVFGSTVFKETNIQAYIAFHLNPTQFTESDDKSYFRLPNWGVGSFPVFSHQNGNKYLSLLPGKKNGESVYTDEKGTILENSKVEKYLPKKAEVMDGYPIYFNVKIENVLAISPV